MEHYILICRSLTYTQRAARLLQRSGMYAAVIKAPQSVSDEGCSYGVRVRGADLERAREILASGGLTVRRTAALGGRGGGL